MLSPSFSSFFPLKRQNMPIFFQAVVFSLNCKRRFYISQFKIFFLFFYPSSPLDLPHSLFCIKHLLQNSSEPRFFPRSPPLAIFLSLHPKFASFFVHNAVFHRSSRPKNPFLSFVFIHPPLSKGRKKGGRSYDRPPLHQAFVFGKITFP